MARLPKGRKEKVLNGKDTEGYTALHYAAKFNRFKILQLLVTSGAGERGREEREGEREGRKGDWRKGRRRKTTQCCRCLCSFLSLLLPFSLPL